MNRRSLALWTPLAMFCSIASAEPTISGRILDEAGESLAGCRVVAREEGGAEFFISPPSDAEGHYVIDVPENSRYALVAVITPAGTRIELDEAAPVAIGKVSISKDVTVPLAAQAIEEAAETARTDRFFLSFVEDPALAETRHYEARLDYHDYDAFASAAVEGLVALQFDAVPRVEVGARGGFAMIDIDERSDETGLTDLDMWGKFQVWRSSDARFDIAAGALVTLPTGDADSGLGQDAVQSKLFAGASWALGSMLLVGHAGLATAEDGEMFGQPLDGQVTATASAGILVPLDRVSLVFEADWDGERFDDLPASSEVLAGANWQIRERGQVRVAVAAGLGEVSDLTRFVAGYAWLF